MTVLSSANQKAEAHNHFSPLSPPILFCSGDFDSVCSITATRFSVNDLNLTVTTKWRPWYTPDSEVRRLFRTGRKKKIDR